MKYTHCFLLFVVLLGNGCRVNSNNHPLNNSMFNNFKLNEIVLDKTVVQNQFDVEWHDVCFKNSYDFQISTTESNGILKNITDSLVNHGSWVSTNLAIKLEIHPSTIVTTADGRKFNLSGIVQCINTNVLQKSNYDFNDYNQTKSTIIVLKEKTEFECDLRGILYVWENRFNTKQKLEIDGVNNIVRFGENAIPQHESLPDLMKKLQSHEK